MWSWESSAYRSDLVLKMFMNIPGERELEKKRHKERNLGKRRGRRVTRDMLKDYHRGLLLAGRHNLYGWSRGVKRDP